MNKWRRLQTARLKGGIEPEADINTSEKESVG